MGNTSSDIIGEEYKKKFDSEIQYELYRKKEISDVFNCEVTIYRERSTDRYVASFDKGYSNNQFDEEMLDYLQKRIAANDSQLIKIKGYFSDTSAESICGNSYQQCYFVDYPIGTLRNEIDLRKFMNKSFKETELWTFLITIVEGLRIIKKIGKTCRNISSSTIFIDDEGGYRISEQGLVKGISLFEETVLKIYAKDIYLSPEQVHILKALDPLPKDTTDPFMSDIFSLGALLVEMMYLENQADLFKYNPDEGQIVAKVRELKARLPFNGSYSQTLQRLISQMIEKKVKNRINLEELSEQLQISYDRYLASEYGEEGGKAVKMEINGKTTFLEYILKRSEYEKEYRWGNYGQDDSTEQQLRRAQANKVRNYQSKINIEDFDNEEEGDGLQKANKDNKMQLSKFLALQNEKKIETTNQQQQQQQNEHEEKIIEEKEFDGQSNAPYEQEAVVYENQDSEYQVNNSLRRASHKKYQQSNEHLFDSEIKSSQLDETTKQQQQQQQQQRLQQQYNQQILQHSQSSQLIQSSQSHVLQQHSNLHAQHSLQLQQTPASNQDSTVLESANKYKRILSQNVPLKFMQPYFKSTKTSHSPHFQEPDKFASPSDKDSVVRSSSQSNPYQQKQQQEQQQQFSSSSRQGSSSMHQQQPHSSNQNLTSRTNKRCNIDHFDMRISKGNVVSDKFKQIYTSFKSRNNPNSQLLTLSSRNNVNVSTQNKISSTEGISTPAAISFRSNIVKKKSISQILRSNAKKAIQNSKDANNNTPSSPLRANLTAKIERALSPVIASSNNANNNAKFFQNTFSQGFSLTANKNRFLAGKLSVSPI